MRHKRRLLFLLLLLAGPSRPAPVTVSPADICGVIASNTIVVGGKARFQEQVRVALQAICPCYIVSIVEGRVLLASPADFDRFCQCYCARRAGCNLLFNLSGSILRVTITRTTGGNEYNPDNDTVSWNPTRRPEVRTEASKRRTPVELTLAHELIHALHDSDGTLSADQRTEEENTVRGENQIRDESGGPPRRTHHDDRRVPNHRQPNIDASNRTECRCP